MSIRYFIMICCCLYCCTGFGQQEDVWILGTDQVDFSGGQPVVTTVNASQFNEAGACICDNSGQLLFYTNGDTVWNRNYQMMPNGYNMSDGIPVYSTSQGTIIVPVPFHSNLYYIFSLTSIENGINGGRLYYSLLDMDLDNGLGDVIAGQKGVLIDSNLTERMTAIAGDHCNVWLITRSKNAAAFKSYNVTATGISTTPVISATGTMDYTSYLIGGLTPSPDGHKVLSAGCGGGGGGGVELYDFDPASGMLSNPQVLDNTHGYYYAAFSPDQSKVYALTHWMNVHLYQFDLDAADPGGSMFDLGSIFAFDKLKLAPDGKIYFAGNGGLNRIEQPDFPGSACNRVDNAIIVAEPGITLPNTVPVVAIDTTVPSVSALTGPCWGRPLTLSTPAGSFSCTWSEGLSSNNIQVGVPGDYWVHYYTPSCTFHSDTFHVSFPDGVLPALTIDTACTGSTNGKAVATTYAGDTVTYHYTWRNADGDTLSQSDSLTAAPTGNYELHISTASCDTTLSVYIPHQLYRVSFTADSFVCLGSTATFTNTSDAGGFSNFHWTYGDGNEDDSYDAAHDYTEPGSYTVQLTGTGSICTDTTSWVIVADAADTPSFAVISDKVCIGTLLELQVTADSTIRNYEWTFGDNSAYTTSEVAIEHAYDGPGNYIVRLTGHYRACPDAVVEAGVQVYPLPVVNLSKDTMLCLGGAPVTLGNLLQSTGGVQYEWSTGDTTATIQVVHPGRYSLTLTVDSSGCSTTDAVTVNKDCYIDIPNAFTPNGDGVNDYFFPRSLLTKSLKTIRLRVWTRWGQQVFETNNIAGRGWDGRYNNEEQPGGVYVYDVQITFDNGKEEHYQGNVTLLR